MRNRTWKEYNRDLVNRGSLTFFIDKDSLVRPSPSKKARGRPVLFPLPIIRLLLILKIQYRLTYRALEGFSKSLLPLLQEGIALPTYSLICKRASNLGSFLPKLSRSKPKIILLDATGIKVAGEGEWKVKVHGKNKRRKWIKVHIALNEKTQEIIRIEVTDSRTADCVAGLKLIDECPNTSDVYLADGAYDTKSIRREIKRKGAKALIPPRKNATSRSGMQERNQAISERKSLGLDEVGISLWGKLTGYSRRALVETAFSRMKGLYGPMFYSRKMEAQKVECHLKCWMLNQMMKKVG